MYFINLFISSILLVFTLTHHLLHTHVVVRVLKDSASQRGTTSVLMLVLCVLFPVLPLALLIVGTSLGVVSMLTLGALMPKSTQVSVIRKTEARVVEITHMES